MLRIRINWRIISTVATIGVPALAVDYIKHFQPRSWNCNPVCATWGEMSALGWNYVRGWKYCHVILPALGWNYFERASANQHSSIYIIAKHFRLVNSAEFKPGVEYSPCNQPLIAELPPLQPQITSTLRLSHLHGRGWDTEKCQWDIFHIFTCPYFSVYLSIFI